MVFVLAIIIGAWLLRWLELIKTPVAAAATYGVLALTVLAHLIAPEGGYLPMVFGGSFRGWLSALILAVVVGAYIWGIRWIKTRAKPAPEAPKQGAFTDTELDRYARHIIMREIGGPGQKALKNAKVLVIGAGGLGSPALLYLAAAGVGTIGVIDDDVVDNSNLQRQVIHRDADIDVPKVFSAKAAMEAQNPAITVRPYNQRLTEDNAAELFAEYDVILEGSDNFATRYLANRVAAEQKKPMVGGALTQWEGQISVYDPAHDAPCYQCVFPEAPAPGLAPSCAEAGVVGPLPGVIGSMMAVEAVKLITEAGEALRGRLMIYDALYAESRMIKVKKQDNCPVCGSGN